ncbi:MAG: type 4a pilus biogenesis protein PilO, partial [Patescibacteria group bacterium]
NDFIKLNMKNKIIINITVIIVFMSAIGYFIIMPTISDIRKMESEIEAQRTDLEKKYVKGQSLKKLSENLKKIEPNLVVFDQIFINQSRALEFITTLEDIANRHGVTQKLNLMTEKGAGSNGYTKTPLNFNIDGDFTDIMRYLADIESLNYYINVSSIEISKIQGESGSPSKVSVQILAHTYWK